MTHLLLEMLLSPWFWLNILLSVAGGVIVYVGLKTEKAGEKMLIPPDLKPGIFSDIEEVARSKIELGWRILMTGIAFEVVAAFGISVISGLEIASLSDQTAAAQLESKRAEKQAGEANERASLIESNNIVLRKGLQARVITEIQISNFIFLTKNFPKIPIRVAASSLASPEADSYAWQLKRMFNLADFPSPNADSNSFLGIHLIEGAMSVPMFLGISNYPSSHIQLIFNASEDPTVFHFRSKQTNANFVRYDVDPKDTNSVYGVLVNYLNQDDIMTVAQFWPQCEATNEYELFVTEKIFIPPSP